MNRLDFPIHLLQRTQYEKSYLVKQIMKTTLKYQGMIAPCGMNCGLCISRFREDRACGGCFKIDDPHKPKVCRSCKIINCVLLIDTESGFCFDCKKYPCVRLKNLDKRYRIRYRMSLIDNLGFIQKQGLGAFLEREEEKWKCPVCGEGLCVHRDSCLCCHAERPQKES